MGTVQGEFQRYAAATVHNLDLILTLAGGLSAALALGFLTHRLGLSPIVGYLLAGTLVGPHTPGFVADATLAEQLAEVGVILLMFGVGLQFHLDELLAVRRIAIPGAIAQSAVATLLGMAIGAQLQWSWAAGLIFGVALSVASTVVLIRVLSDNRDLHTPTGHIAVGWLVVEDLFTVIALVVLPVVLDGGAAGASTVATALAFTLLKVAGLVAFTAYVGARLIPYVLDAIAATRSRELFTLGVLAIALGIAVGSALIFGVSMALGAFLAGMIVGRSDFSLRAASEALPMRDAFAVLFFVSVGMLLDPAALLDQPWLLAGTLAVVLIGKPLVALLIVRLMRYPFRVALAVAVALAQIGEFSFILSSLGRELGVLSAEAANTLVAVSIASIIVNPILYRLVVPIDAWASRHPLLWRLLNPPRLGEASGDAAPPVATDAAHRALVIGYGPTGRTVVRLLLESGIHPIVIDLNMESVREAREQGASAVYGDATSAETLEQAGIASARSLLLTAAALEQSEAVIQVARRLHPHIHITARSTYLRDSDALKAAGASVVFSGEAEVALAFVGDVMERLGATPEQLDRERARVHAELREI